VVLNIIPVIVGRPVALHTYLLYEKGLRVQPVSAKRFSGSRGKLVRRVVA
jgi:hypothetical protein